MGTRAVPFTQQWDKLLLRGLEGVGVDQGRVDRLGEALIANALFQRGMVLSNEAAHAGDDVDDPLLSQFGVGLEAGVAIHIELNGEGTNPGEGVSPRRSPDAAAYLIRSAIWT